MSKKKWILMAEDDNNDAELIQRMLTDKASHVELVRAKDGAEALDCLYHRNRFKSFDHGPPALVLLDLNMPRVNGFEVLQQVKSDPELKAVPITVFTSSKETADLVRCYQLGANAYLVKPVDFGHLLETVQEIIRFWINFNEPSPNVTAKTAAVKMAA